jgi:hypothetical protein
MKHMNMSVCGIRFGALSLCSVMPCFAAGLVSASFGREVRILIFLVLR